MSPFTLLAANSSPYFLHRLVKLFFKDRATKMVRSRTKKLRELEGKNLVRFQKMAADSIKLDLTPIGRVLAKKFWKQKAIEEIRPNTIRNWDGKWYLLIYDLAELNKSAKDAFCRQIKKWGLYLMKRTVWVSPFDCEKELNKLCAALKINPNKIIYTSTAKIANEATLKKYFRLTSDADNQKYSKRP